MNLTSVKYQDSCIYIGLDGSLGKCMDGASLEGIKNIYVVYKIKAYDNYVRDTILVNKRDINFVQGMVAIKFELNQLHHPEECEIEIVSLKVVYESGKREELTVDKSYSFLEIRASNPNATKKTMAHENKKGKPRKINKSSENILSMTQEIIVPPLEEKKSKELEDSPLSLKKGDQQDQSNFSTIIKRTTPPSIIVSKVESLVETKVDAHARKLELDIRQLCLETVDLLLTSLPQLELAEEYRASNSMVKSIHRYINADLLQKEQEEGETV